MEAENFRFELTNRRGIILYREESYVRYFSSGGRSLDVHHAYKEKCREASRVIGCAILSKALTLQPGVIYFLKFGDELLNFNVIKNIDRSMAGLWVGGIWTNLAKR